MKEKTSKKFVIGVDLGGTKILSAIVDKKGNIIHSVNIPTEAASGKEKVIQNITASIKLLLKSSGVPLSSVGSIGIGAPGPVDFRKGVILNPPNLPGWEEVPLATIIEKEFNKKVFLENDANAAALGEAEFGSAKGVKNFVYVTVSTGIGGGLVLNGELYRGGSGGAGEIGHMVIKTNGPKCGCGNFGCLEAMASGEAMARLARDRVKDDKSSLILQKAGNDISKIDSLSVELAAKDGDKLANEIIAEISFYLGIGMSNLVNILCPDMIAMGGGVMNMGEMILGPVRETVKRLSLSPAKDNVKIVRAKLGKDVGVIGAAALCL